MLINPWGKKSISTPPPNYLKINPKVFAFMVKIYVLFKHKSVGPSGPQCTPQFHAHLWEVKEDGREATTKTSTIEPKLQALGGFV